MWRWISVAFAVAACGGAGRPPGPVPGRDHATAPAADEPVGGRFSMRLGRMREPLVDATFDVEARGGGIRRRLDEGDERLAWWTLAVARADIAACVAEVGGRPGDVPVRLTVSTGGKVTKMWIEARDPAVRECVSERLGRVVYPDPGPFDELRLYYVYELAR